MKTLRRLLGFRFTAPLVALLLVLAGCGGDDGGEGGGGDAEAASEFEFFSWWTGPGDSEGKEALLELYSEQNPDV
jgi:glucose/mannose transport system substrate-binding protein